MQNLVYGCFERC